MNTELCYNQSDFFCRWAGAQLNGDPESFSRNAVAIGVLLEGKPIAAVVYNNYATDSKRQPLLIEMTIASVDKRWCTRHNLNALFSYPFVQLGLKRVQSITSVNNEGVSMFLKRLGFKQEGIHPCAYSDGGDAVSFGMLKTNCKWIKDGKEVSSPATSS